MKKIITFILMLSFLFTNVSAAGTDADIKSQLKNSIIMFLSENQVFINGSLLQLDENPEVVPFTENDRTLVPLRFIIEQFSGEVLWNSQTEEITITIDKKEFLFQINNKTLKFEGKSIEMEAVPKLHLEKTFVPLRVIAENLGKELFYKDGVIIISNEKSLLTDLAGSKQSDIVDSLKNKIFFDDKKDIEETQNSETDFTKLSKYIKGNPASEYLLLKSDKTLAVKRNTILGEGVNVENMNSNLKAQNIEIDSIDDCYFLSTDNKLYSVYTKSSGGSFPRSELDFELEKENIVDFSINDRFLITLTSDGTVEVSLNEGVKKKYSASSEQIIFKYIKQGVYPELKNVKNVFACDEICFVTTNDGKLFGWGRNEFGQLGNGDKKDKKEPVLISDSLNIKYIISESNYTIAITTNNELFGWGRNAGYRLTNFENVITPTKLEGISDVIHCAIEGSYTLAVKNDGTVWITGDISETPFFNNNLKTTKEFIQIPEISNILYANFSLEKENDIFEYITYFSTYGKATRIRAPRYPKSNTIISTDGIEYSWNENSKSAYKKTYSDLCIRYE